MRRMKTLNLPEASSRRSHCLCQRPALPHPLPDDACGDVGEGVEVHSQIECGSPPNGIQSRLGNDDLPSIALPVVAENARMFEVGSSGYCVHSIDSIPWKIDLSKFVLIW